jgi:hypothetical protein
VIEVGVREDMGGESVLSQEAQQAPGSRSPTRIYEDSPDEIDVDQVGLCQRYPCDRFRNGDGVHSTAID